MPDQDTFIAMKWFKRKKSAEKKEKSDSSDQTPAAPPLTTDEAADNQDKASVGLEADVAEAPDDLPEAPPPPLPRKNGKGLFSRLKKGLTKTRDILTTDIDKLFGARSEINDELLEELEELLITSDIGVQTAMKLMETVEKQASKVKSPDDLKKILKQEILTFLDDATPTSSLQGSAKPHVIMVVGVNGVGKTTTIGKLAAHATGQGRSVLIAAADTFRAAAIEQLAVWADRAGADLVRHKENSDPAAVAFDAIEAAMARGTDTVFVDTAGRLHTKVNLMEEIKKIKRTIAKKIPEAPHEILLVLDATTGQNALSQAKMFNEALDITGLALTKLDGTAKGGIVISICQTLQIPLHFIGVGESIEDLQPFVPEKFAEALF
jgi:fused signal recognition particle receptor